MSYFYLWWKIIVSFKLDQFMMTDHFHKIVIPDSPLILDKLDKYIIILKQRNDSRTLEIEVELEICKCITFTSLNST